MRLLFIALLFASFGLCRQANAFQPPHQSKKTSASFVSAGTSTQLFNQWLSLERTAHREIDQFQGWAGSCGVSAENGFYLEGEMVDGNEDYFAATSSGAAQGSRVLYVPGEMILASSWIAQEYNGYIESSLQVLAELGMKHLIKHFYLFVKILVEYEQGEDSPYFPWFQSMPRKWNTAISMGKSG
jgi:hypothetical protein